MDQVLNLFYQDKSVNFYPPNTPNHNSTRHTISSS